ncbi:MAG: ATP-binding protein [Myxococcota bacterium]
MASGELPLFLTDGDQGDFTRDRLHWLIRMRWVAMLGAMVATLLGFVGVLPSMAWGISLGAAGFGLAYNYYLWSSLRRGEPSGRRAAIWQALIDLVLLTVLLWSAGGIDCPFLGFYIFHVALIAILGGPRWTLIASVAAFAGASLLALPKVFPALEVGVWDPVAPFDVLAQVVAFVVTVSGAAYIVTHAVNELRDRERALKSARDQAALEYQLLSNTLDELEAGLEVVAGDGTVLWRNKRAEELAPMHPGPNWECPGEHRPCERDVEDDCPVARARAIGESGRCRFAARIDGRERVYEMLVFPIDESDPSSSVMNLYVDRTQATLAERQLMLAERLASLGRVAQGVAHELNTPLATIATLAADMRRALVDVDADQEVVDDIDESATLIRDETRRLGRITQALLAGGDLVRARIDGPVPLSAAVERARAIVSAGARKRIPIDVDKMSELHVSADNDRLVQVLVNLLQNAVDATLEHEGASVQVRAFSEVDEVVVEVVDDGPGVSDDIRQRLFEPFATTKPPGEGTGLGLYTSYMLIQAMGGQLSLDDGSERGAVARVRLPRADADAPVHLALGGAR